MPHEAIVGARYMDTVFNSEFVIVAVEADSDGDGLPDAENITVMIEYEDRPDGRLEDMDLDTFRHLDEIYLCDIPEHAG